MTDDAKLVAATLLRHRAASCMPPADGIDYDGHCKRPR